MVLAATPVGYCFAQFELQVDQRRLLSGGVPVPLRPLAFGVLAVLVERAGHLVTKDELLRRVWGRVVVEENTLQAHISALRKVLGADAIATVSGQGYRFSPAVVPGQAARQTAPVPATPQNLPHTLTTFIGRADEIAEVRRLLATTRLLTLTGAGGCGKTRLAVEVAAGMLSAYPDGVSLVELARLADPTLIDQVLAKALGLESSPGKDMLDTLCEWLGSRRVLLLLDNTEHLIEASARLADQLLRRCAGLTVLVTSRERLGIDGEMTYRVPSLSVPMDGGDVLASEAARLFVDRVRLIQPDFDVPAADEAALAAVCRGLDGIALAIELAAPKLRVMNLQTLSARIDDRFRMLTGGSRAALPRHQTLRSLVDWSHDLLSWAEKTVLRRASIFAGGWTLAAAERVCGGEGLDAVDVLGLLASLVDKSLVNVNSKGDDTRYGMLETVRHYALEQLRGHGEEMAVRERQREHLDEMAEGLQAPDGASALLAVSRLAAEHDNVRDLLAWSAGEPARAIGGMHLAGRLELYFFMQGAFDESMTLMTKLLAAAPDDLRPDLRAIVLKVCANCLACNGDMTRAAVHVEQAVQLLRQAGDRRWLGRSLMTLGHIQQHRGELDAVTRCYDEAAAIAREVADQRDLFAAIGGFANLAMQSGDYAAAQRWLDEILVPSRAIAPWISAQLYLIQAAILRFGGDFEAAQAPSQSSVDCFRACGLRSGLAIALLGLSRNSLDLGNVPAAWAQWRESADWQPGGCDNWLPWLDTGAGLLATADHTLEAARLWGCLQTHCEQRGVRWRSPIQIRRQEAVRQAAGEAAFDGALAEGGAWTLDQGARRLRALAEDVDRVAEVC